VRLASLNEIRCLEKDHPEFVWVSGSNFSVLVRPGTIFLEKQLTKGGVAAIVGGMRFLLDSDDAIGVIDDQGGMDLLFSLKTNKQYRQLISNNIFTNFNIFPGREQ
jgi:hypothetical protein